MVRANSWFWAQESFLEGLGEPYGVPGVNLCEGWGLQKEARELPPSIVNFRGYDVTMDAVTRTN